MIQQRYGNNIPLRISIATQVPLAERKVAVSIMRRNGRTVPFAYTIEGNTIVGVIFGKDQPHREDVLSVRIQLDLKTERQQIIDIPNVVCLMSKTTYATMGTTQMVFITTDGSRSNVQLTEQPRKKVAPVRPVARMAATTPSHERMSNSATPDITLS